MSPEKKRWYEELSNRSGYMIKASFDKITSNGAIEKKVDINIAIDIISLAHENAYDTMFLVSGDGNFIININRIEELDKIIEVCVFRYSAIAEQSHYIRDLLFLKACYEKLKVIGKSISIKLSSGQIVIRF